MGEEAAAAGATEANGLSDNWLLRVQLPVSAALAAGILWGFSTLNFHTYSLVQAGRAVWTPVLPIDAVIPFWPAWIWAYCLYYPLCFAPLVLRELRVDRALFWRMIAAYVFQFGVAFLIFWFFPSRMIRPGPPTGGLTAFGLGLLYRLDPGCNALPSMHACNMVFTACVFARFRPGLKSFFVMAAAAGVISATVLIKQHYFLDAIAGAALGACAFYLFVPQLQSAENAKLLQFRA